MCTVHRSTYMYNNTVLQAVINPRCACAGRVTVLGLCVCVCVCVCVCEACIPVRQRLDRKLVGVPNFPHFP